MADLQTSMAQRRNGKSAAAFRTISEVADDLEVPPHVLRFWETKFNQVRPLKRGGGRRYYRPEDVALLQRIRELLYREGYTIKGVQKLLRDGAVRMPTAGETARAAQSATPVKGGAAPASASPASAMPASPSPVAQPPVHQAPVHQPSIPQASPPQASLSQGPAAGPPAQPAPSGDREADLRLLLDELKELRRKLARALA